MQTSPAIDWMSINHISLCAATNYVMHEVIPVYSISDVSVMNMSKFSGVEGLSSRVNAKRTYAIL